MEDGKNPAPADRGGERGVVRYGSHCGPSANEYDVYVLASDYDAALCTLAEVRGECEKLRSHAVEDGHIIDELENTIDAATQRAEQAEAGLTTIGDLICTECVPCQRIREVISAALPAPATMPSGARMTVQAGVEPATKVR